MSDPIIGATVIAIRPMTADEMKAEGWMKREVPACVVLSTGVVLYPSMDTEGNDAGALFGIDSAGSAFCLG